MTVTHVSSGGESGDRDSITVGHVKVPVKVYRTNGFPTIFAGLRTGWIDGEDPKTGAVFSMSAGAGFGSEYLTIDVTLPDGARVYEYVDVTELLRDRVGAILAESEAK